MSGLADRGWDQVGLHRYVHHCGAKIGQRGKQPWKAVTVSGLCCGGHASPGDAEAWLRDNDSLFWSAGSLGSFGALAGLVIITGYLDADDKDHVVVCSLAESSAFPARLTTIFERRFLAFASCVRCGGGPGEIILRHVAGANRFRSRLPTIVCHCGHPVWRITAERLFEFERAVQQSERMRRRRANLREAGGRHSAAEIAEILRLQRNRCFYCNVRFSERVPPTKDHLEPAVSGGTEWALNIVMACRRCNGERSDLGFDRYCAQLNMAQNQRILRHLQQRLAAIRVDDLPDPTVATAFCAITNSFLKRYRSRLRRAGISAK